MPVLFVNKERVDIAPAVAGESAAAIASAIAGSARWLIPPGPAGGSHPSFTAKSWMRSTARKKFGMPMPSTTT